MKTTKQISNTFLLVLLLHSVSFAQLKVRNNGRVGIGTFNPLTRLHVTGDYALFTANTTPINSAAFIRCNNNLSAATNPEYTWFFDDQTGLFHPLNNTIGFSVAGVERMRLKNASMTLGVQGGINANSFIQWSDKRFKKDIITLNGALDRVLKLRGVSYEYKEEEARSYNFESGKTFGFIAQEVQAIIPEVVKDVNNDGYLGVNYDAIIPFLVEAIKEQSAKIAALEDQVKVLSSSLAGKNSFEAGSSAIASTINGDKPVLVQNSPNPFNVETIIKYSIPSTTGSANIYVYDLNGNKKKTIQIQSKGEGSSKIAANELGQGVYFYSLVADGVIYDSKTMLITQ